MIDNLEDIAEELEVLLRGLDESTLPPAMQNMGVGEEYLFKGYGGVFTDPFTFVIKEDNKDHYVISVLNKFESKLDKSFELLEAMDRGLIVKI